MGMQVQYELVLYLTDWILLTWPSYAICTAISSKRRWVGFYFIFFQELVKKLNLLLALNKYVACHNVLTVCLFLPFSLSLCLFCTFHTLKPSFFSPSLHIFLPSHWFFNTSVSQGQSVIEATALQNIPVTT